MKLTLLKFAAVIALAFGSMSAFAQSACPTIASTDATVANFTVLTQADANYGPHGIVSVNTQNFQQLFSEPPQSKPWPGVLGTYVTVAVPANRYVSVPFTVPANFFGTKPVYGSYTLGETNASTPLAMTISTACGDFSDPATKGSTVLPGCFKTSVKPDGGITWSNNPTATQCKIENGKTYYLNFINAITNSSGTAAASLSNRVKNNLQKSPYCPGKVCGDPLINGFGSWAN